MNKKAQGISINTIIIAAIALIVLVVLIAIFTGRLGTFTGGVESCEDKGGKCAVLPSDSTPFEVCDRLEKAPLRGTNCDRKEQICCIPITETPSPSPPSTGEEPPIPPG